jgi:tetratricopeptide (TPR) repeat protein
MRLRICTVTVLFFVIGPGQIVADGATDEATYQKAIQILKGVSDSDQQAKDLITKSSNAKSYEEEQRLRKQAETLLDQSKKGLSEARTLMQSIAPVDRAGYAQAHLWMFDDLYRMQAGPDGKPVAPSPQTILECERRLLHALESRDDDAKMRAHFGLARLYRDTNRVADAKKHLIIVAEKHPEYRLILAQWAKAEKAKDEVMVGHAQAALARFSERLKQNADDHEARFGCVSCLILLADLGQAERLVNEGAVLATTPELTRAYARKLVEIMVASFDAKEKDPKSSAIERFEIVEMAIKLDPDNPDIFNRMLRLMKDKSIAEKVRERLKKLSESGNTAWLGNLFLGIEAYQESKFEAARNYWEKAMKQSDGTPLVANNLAYLLAFHEPVDLPRALELASDAVKRVPSENRYRGTYGHILAKLGRNNEALPELERSIPVYPNDPQLFRTLSEVCTKLGDSKKAAEYKKRADTLDTKPESGGP